MVLKTHTTLKYPSIHSQATHTILKKDALLYHLEREWESFKQLWEYEILSWKKNWGNQYFVNVCSNEYNLIKNMQEKSYIFPSFSVWYISWNVCHIFLVHRPHIWRRIYIKNLRIFILNNERKIYFIDKILRHFFELIFFLKWLPNKSRFFSHPLLVWNFSWMVLYVHT